jgi:hypothetical protein
MFKFITAALCLLSATAAFAQEEAPVEADRVTVHINEAAYLCEPADSAERFIMCVCNDKQAYNIECNDMLSFAECCEAFCSVRVDIPGDDPME